MATTKKKPWEVAGLSKSTYYRREEEKRLAAEGKAPVKRGRPAKKPLAKSVRRATRAIPSSVAIKVADQPDFSEVQPLEAHGTPRPHIDLHPADRVMVDEFLAVFGPLSLKRFDRRSITGGMVSALITVLKFHGYGPDPDGN